MFTKNRDRLLTTDMSRKVMAATLARREVAPPDDEDPGAPPLPESASNDQPEQTKPETDPMPRSNHQNRNAEVDFPGEKRSNVTHASTTVPDARL